MVIKRPPCPEEQEQREKLEENKKIADWKIQKDIEQLEKEGFYNDPDKHQEKKLKTELLEEYGAVYLDDKGKERVNNPSLAKLLMRADSRDYLIIKDTKQILFFNGTYFLSDGESIVCNRINYYLDTKTTNRNKQETVGFIKNCDPIERQDLDQSPNIINLKNGILDINTGKLLSHDSKYTFQYVLPVKYDKDAKCPIWTEFIKNVLYQEDIPFMQEVCGFLLYRLYRWALLVILLGHGRNGKTVFINAISALLGEDNTEHIPLQTLAHERFAKAKLYQKHANMCSELGAKEINNTEAIKQLTGMDMIFARELYKNGFNFRNYAKLMFACNLLPEIGDKTPAMNERIAVIEFPNVFKRGTPECDTNMLEKLTTPEEMSGILNWMIKGLRRLLKNEKFSEYRTFENVADYLKQSQDTVNMFTTTYVISSSTGEIQKEHLYKKYLEFCKLHNFPTLDNVWFSRKFKKFAPHSLDEGQPRRGGHKATWKGIDYKDEKEKKPTDRQLCGI